MVLWSENQGHSVASSATQEKAEAEPLPSAEVQGYMGAQKIYTERLGGKTEHLQALFSEGLPYQPLPPRTFRDASRILHFFALPLSHYSGASQTQEAQDIVSRSWVNRGNSRFPRSQDRPQEIEANLQSHEYFVNEIR